MPQPIRPYLLLVPVVASLWSLSATASAFYVEQRGGATWRYDTAEPLEYRIAADIMGGDATADAIRAAFATWDAVACSELTFVEGDRDMSPSTTPWMGGSRYITVYFGGPPDISSGAVATYRNSSDADGNLVGAAIILNGTDFTWSTTGEAAAFDVQAVVTSLIGRSLGITSSIEGNATRPAYRQGSDDARTLGADDTAAITYLYPAAGCMPDDPEAVCDGMTAGCPPLPMTGGGRDGGVGDDAGPGSDGGGGPPAPDSGAARVDGGGGADGGATMPEPEDDGCGCRVASHKGAGNAVLVAVALGIVLQRRRQRRRPA